MIGKGHNIFVCNDSSVLRIVIFQSSSLKMAIIILKNTEAMFRIERTDEIKCDALFKKIWA